LERLWSVNAFFFWIIIIFKGIIKVFRLFPILLIRPESRVSVSTWGCLSQCQEQGEKGRKMPFLMVALVNALNGGRPFKDMYSYDYKAQVDEVLKRRR